MPTLIYKAYIYIFPCWYSLTQIDLPIILTPKKEPKALQRELRKTRCSGGGVMFQ